MIEEIIQKQRAFFATGTTFSYAFRMEMLKRLQNALTEQEEELGAALQADLGKSRFESYETELGLVREEIRFTMKRLKGWMRPEKVKTPLMHFPSSSKIYREPMGVVLIMSPWNYPLQLTLSPLVGVIAAGNCAVVKPSRYSEKTSAALERLLNGIFPEEYVAVFQGGSAVNTELLQQRFDHIFFTGSPAVGRVVLESAAKNLTPVTLELGGKSPCIVDATANIPLAATRIVWGKFLNSGQTCVAPDYVLCDERIAEPLIREMCGVIKRFYGENPLDSPDYGKIINERHFQRLTALLSDGEPACGGYADEDKHRIAPTILTGVNEQSDLLHEEIFGPILPVVTYHKPEEAEHFILSREKPLALYLFTADSAFRKRILERIPFGGGCVNDTVVHMTNPFMHFGGVGNSGMGAYHGEKSFETFSHAKCILTKSTRLDIALRYPPYGNKINSIKKWMK